MPKPNENMKNRVIRVPDDLWDAAMDKATQRGESLAEVIRSALRRYVGGQMKRLLAVAAVLLAAVLLGGCANTDQLATPAAQPVAVHTQEPLSSTLLTVTWTPASGRFVTSTQVPAGDLNYVCYWGANLEVVRGGKLGITAPQPAYAAGAPRHLPTCKGMPAVS